MDIAAFSSAASQAALAQAVSLRVMGMVKDQAVSQNAELLKMMELSVNPNLGGQLDIKV